MEEAFRLELTSFYRGSLKIFQPKEGFRFSLPSVLLAHFLEVKKEEKVLEIGAGPGIISFIALLRFPWSKIFLLEIEPLYLEALRRGIRANAFQERAWAVKGNIKTPPFKPNFFDVLLANPPYFKVGSGRENPSHLENLSRRESVPFKVFLKSASTLLKTKGRFYLVFNALRLAEVLDALKEVKLEPKVLRLIHPYPSKPANLFLLKAIKGAKEEIQILPPLYIYKGKGEDYTEEVKEYLWRF